MNKEQEERFDLMFPQLRVYPIGNDELERFCTEDVKDFLTTALQEQKQAIIKLLKNEGLHLGYANNIIDKINDLSTTNITN